MMWLLFPVSFSYPSQGSNAHSASGGMGQFSRYPEHLTHTGKDVVQGAGDKPVKKAPGRVHMGTQSGLGGCQDMLWGDLLPSEALLEKQKH